MTFRGFGGRFFGLLLLFSSASGCGIVTHVDRGKIDAGADAGPDAEGLDAGEDALPDAAWR